MNPYRESAYATIEIKRGRTRRRTRRKTAGWLMMIAVCASLPFSIGLGALALLASGVVVSAGMAMAFAGRSRSGFVRLCALQWNRGDRLGAALLLFNVIEPRYSAKRIARNAAALAAAQVGMPKWKYVPFVD